MDLQALPSQTVGQMSTQDTSMVNIKFHVLYKYSYKT